MMERIVDKVINDVVAYTKKNGALIVSKLTDTCTEMYYDWCEFVSSTYENSVYEGTLHTLKVQEKIEEILLKFGFAHKYPKLYTLTFTREGIDVAVQRTLGIYFDLESAKQAMTETAKQELMRLKGDEEIYFGSIVENYCDDNILFYNEAYTEKYRYYLWIDETPLNP